jgi:Mg-chelatase subunit ChlI
MRPDENANETLKSMTCQSGDPAAALEQIRELLFGKQMRDYESRFGRFEDTLVREMADIKDMVGRRLSTIESSRKKDVEDFEARLEAEKNARRELAKDSARELKDATDALSNKLTELEHSTSKAESDIRSQQAVESSRLHNELRRIQDELTALLNEQAGQLRRDKVDRVMLGSLLTNVVKKISDGA